MKDSNNDPSRDDYDSQSEENLHREIHEWASSKSLSGTVVTALAEYSGVDSTELEPLYEQIDLDALDTLFDCNGNGIRSGGQVSFSINDDQVTIHSHGEFAVVSIRKKLSDCVDCRTMTDDTAFESALQTLVQMAAQNNIGVSGGWRVESPSFEFPDWEVVITELAEWRGDSNHSEE